MLGHRSLSRLALPFKGLPERFVFGVLLALSIGLLAVGRMDVGILESAGTRIGDGLAPILSVVTQPIGAARHMAGRAGELIALHQENARLREQSRRLLEWQAVARRLAFENAGLRRMLNLDVEPDVPTATTGRVVADTGGPFVHTVIVDAGTRRGVAKGMAAINERGLVGRVTGVGERSARILLLTDFNSRIPVMVEPSRDQAILAGGNDRTPELIFLPLSPRLQVGDRVVTSGHGGLLPAGVPVGLVSTIDDEKIAVAPFVDWDRLEYVRVLHHPPVRGPASPAAPQPASRGHTFAVDPTPDASAEATVDLPAGTSVRNGAQEPLP